MTFLTVEKLEFLQTVPEDKWVVDSPFLLIDAIGWSWLIALVLGIIYFFFVEESVDSSSDTINLKTFGAFISIIGGVALFVILALVGFVQHLNWESKQVDTVNSFFKEDSVSLESIEAVKKGKIAYSDDKHYAFEKDSKDNLKIYLNLEKDDDK